MPADALDVAVAAARDAASLIREAARRRPTLQVATKGSANDFVSEADLASQALIERRLLGAFPAHRLLGEESAAAPAAGDAPLWIVDPLDGTTNFLHGHPGCAVSIALLSGGDLALGVVLDIDRDEVFHARRGEGAWCGGRRLRVSGRESLAQALVGSSCPWLPGMRFEDTMAMLATLLEHCGALRRSGSAALDLARVADGRLDACCDRGLGAWDVAAGSLLVQEAGGVACNFRGGADILESHECIAAPAPLAAALASLLRSYSLTAD